MSTKIYNAYLFKRDSDFSDLENVQNYLNDLKSKYVDWVAKDMSRFDNLFSLDSDEIMQSLEKSSSNVDGFHFLDYSLDCIVYSKKFDGHNYIAIQFFPSRASQRFISEHVQLKDFHYQDQTDDEQENEPDWEERKRFWDAVFDKNWTAAENGLGYVFYSGREWLITSRISLKFYKLKADRIEKNEQIEQSR